MFPPLGKPKDHTTQNKTVQNCTHTQIFQGDFMGILDAALRKKMPKKDFAGPGKSFPISDPTHARLAISGATRSERAGNISAGTASKIKAKARKKLGI